MLNCVTTQRGLVMSANQTGFHLEEESTSTELKLHRSYLPQLSDEQDEHNPEERGSSSGAHQNYDLNV